MAPRLRPSAPNTPNSKSPGLKESSSGTPRKAPTCSKCKRPKAGHPRSGCPYTDSQQTICREALTENSGQIISELGALHLQPPSSSLEADEDTRATIRQRRRSSLAAALAITQSVASLDTESQEIMDSLMQPRMFDNSPEDGRTPTWSARRRVKMPGSLFSPSPSSSQGSFKFEEPAPAPIDITNDDPVTTSAQNPTPCAPITAVQPLDRSMSMEQREGFLSSLNNASNATVYLVSRDDIHNVQADAIKVGFYARVVLGKDISGSEGLLVLGRNEAAVKHLHEQLEVERKQSGGFRAATAGAVVGAVGAFAGLAFA